MKNLVIVESPTKAKTISKFLGRDFVVKSSFGHVRDLPTKKTGVDIKNNFEPTYVVPPKAKKVVAELKTAAAKVDQVYFASDSDREGEAISWHLSQLLKLPKAKTKRITFHEITASALKRALETPRDIDQSLVDAQQARRILDRLVGYELSPFLWRKVTYGLSAGRVQSVAVRLIVDREREINAFIKDEYWTIEATFGKLDQSATFEARLFSKDGETLEKLAIKNDREAKQILEHINGSSFVISNIERKNTKRTPPAPFTTSTLQQEANNRLGFSAKQTMLLAQQLYEGIELGQLGHVGLITYMRTDSVSLSEDFLKSARDLLKNMFGAVAVPAEARHYKTKARGAQEAHEAIRPSNLTLPPETVRPHLEKNALKLYELIWRRALAGQMIDAEFANIAVTVDADKNNPKYSFRANGSTILKKGFLEIYETDSKETFLPELEVSEKLNLTEINPIQHFTEPPPRFSEATLVKTLEENGIGRPSTYAPTISTVIERGYVEKDDKKLKPTEIAFLVTDLLVAHFPEIVDYQFTAKMEEELDDIAEGKADWHKVLSNFYGPFHTNLKAKESEISKRDLTEEKTDAVCEKCGQAMVIKMGRFGKFLACTGYPDCKNTKPIPGSAEEQQKEQTAASTELCPTCGASMVIKRGRFGMFLSCSKYPDCKTNKPIQKKIGVICPKCNLGDMVEKKTKRGKPFFSCSRYPDCANAYWSKPTGEKCPKCEALLVYAKKDTVACSNKECDYIK